MKDKEKEKTPRCPLKVCAWKHHTWSPRFRPASVALLPGSTLSTKIPNPFSEPPRRMNGKGASREGFVNVISLLFALAAHAMFNSLRCPPIFCKFRKSGFKERLNKMNLKVMGCIFFLLNHNYYLSFQIILKFF